MEHEAAHDPDYTLPSLVDFEGARYELHDGEADLASGVRLVPTPGHVPGHQSLVVTTTKGPVVFAGQAFDSASEYAAAALASHLVDAGWPRDSRPPSWIRQLHELEPWRVVFAHELLEWRGPDPEDRLAAGLPAWSARSSDQPQSPAANDSTAR